MALFKKKGALATGSAAVIDECMRVVRAQFPDVPKLTLVIRSERYKDALIFTNDDPDAAIEAIRSLTTASPNLHRAN